NLSSVGISPDRRWLATGTRHGTGVKIWLAQSGQLVHDLPIQGNANVAFTPDGRWLVTGTGMEYRFWEVGSWKPGHAIPKQDEGDMAGWVVFSRDGALMVVRHSPWRLHLAEPTSGRLLAALESPDQRWIEWYCLSPDGSRLAMGDRHDV